MRVLDFSRSFVTFEVVATTKNNARSQIEARCTMKTGDHEPVEYLLGASCKSENTYAQGNLFKAPNYDFCPIFSDDRYRLHRVGLVADEHTLDAGKITDRFYDVRRTMRECEAEELCDPAAIVKATKAGRVLICRTRLQNANSGPSAVLEYPVKTMNVRSEPDQYQADTGPVLFPDLSGESRAIEGFRLAYVAFRPPDRAAFVIQEPTPVDHNDPDSTWVMHYGTLTALSAENTVYACD